MIVDDWSDVRKIQNALDPSFAPRDESYTRVLDNYMAWGFSDSFTTCETCGEVICTEPDSKHWTPDFWVGDGFICCGDCVRDNPIEYLEYLINNPESANTILRDSDLQNAGFTKLDGSYESGWYDKHDDPHDILDDLLTKYPNGEFIFSISNQQQFMTQFDVWALEESLGEPEEHDEQKENESLKKDEPLKENKTLNEGTSNFMRMKDLPLLIFYTYDEVYDMMDYDENKPNFDDFEDEDAYEEAKDKFEDEYWEKLDICALTEDELDDLRDSIEKFNYETHSIAEKIYDDNVDSDDDHWDDPHHHHIHDHYDCCNEKLRLGVDLGLGLKYDFSRKRAGFLEGKYQYVKHNSDAYFSMGVKIAL